MRVAGAITILLACVMTVSIVAQTNATPDHIVGAAELQAALVKRADADASERALIQTLLSRADVRDWAARSGLDIERAQRRAATIEGDELQRLASHARLADAQLSGGDAVVIGSTAAILILLVIIILLVA